MRMPEAGPYHLPDMKRSRYIDRERYFLELAETSEEFYLDYIRKFKDFGSGSRVLEVGCGEGGNLLPFAKSGCSVAGLDLAPNKIENARRFFRDRNADGEFVCADFLKEPVLLDKGRFDIILVHDVVEHIEPESKLAFFQGLRRYLKPDGIVFFGFPAWQMPFGGHQQICRSKICSKMPFMHLLPACLYKAYLRVFREEPYRIEELLSIKRSGMTPEKFESLCSQSGYRILDRKLWLVSPHYKAKFNLRPRQLGRFFSSIPCLRNFMSTSCFYVISLK